MSPISLFSLSFPMRTRTNLWAPFFLLLCSFFSAGLFAGGMMGRMQEALALEVTDDDPGVPECVTDRDCDRGQYCTAPGEECAAEPGCRDPQKGSCPETCWGYCKEQNEERSTQEIDAGDYCEEVKRRCSDKGAEDFAGCIMQDPKCREMMQDT